MALCATKCAIRHGCQVEHQNRLHLSIHQETAGRDDDWDGAHPSLRSKALGPLNKENYFAEPGRGLPSQKHFRVPLQASIARRLSDRESEKRSQGADNENGTAPSLPPRQAPSLRRSGDRGILQQSGPGVRTGGQRLSNQGATGAVALPVQPSSSTAVGGGGALPLVQFFGSHSSLPQSAHLCPACQSVEEAVAQRASLRAQRQAAALEAAQRIAALELQHMNLLTAVTQGGLEQVGRMGEILESHQMLRQARRDAEQQAQASRDEEAALNAVIDSSSERQEAEELMAAQVLRQRVRGQLADIALLRIEAAIDRQREMAALQRQLVDVLSQRIGAENQEERARLDAEGDRLLQEIENVAGPARNPQRGRRKPA
ncbi:UNVERIFIED_CONTAM: hypothetical protein HHA_245432 [Hammondia hammondi]|eukprot:XP_008883644.1 hypothetical protein HHA_245432 [Hammondia hammondi]